mmetsp:Transcript_25935/g.75089  ORF Transcript_25935/g.75089 Transcript_25935/m.75089 type:complete len:210 (-) Transcript_25935:24-653(-)
MAAAGRRLEGRQEAVGMAEGGGGLPAAGSLSPAAGPIVAHTAPLVAGPTPPPPPPADWPSRLAHDDELDEGGDGRAAQRRVLEVAELYGEGEGEALLGYVLLGERDRLGRHQHRHRPLGCDGDVLAVADAAGDRAGELEAVGLVLDGEVVLGRLPLDDLRGAVQLVRDVRRLADVSLEGRLDDYLHRATLVVRLLMQVLARDGHGLARL